MVLGPACNPAGVEGRRGKRVDIEGVPVKADGKCKLEIEDVIESNSDEPSFPLKRPISPCTLGAIWLVSLPSAKFASPTLSRLLFGYSS